MTRNTTAPTTDAELAACGLTRADLDALLAEPAIALSVDELEALLQTGPDALSEAQLDQLIDAYYAAGDDMAVERLMSTDGRAFELVRRRNPVYQAIQSEMEAKIAAARREEITARLADTITGPIAVGLLEWAQRELGEATYDALRRAANPEGLPISAWQRNYDAGFYGPATAALRAELAELHARVSAMPVVVTIAPAPGRRPELWAAIEALTAAEAWAKINALNPSDPANSFGPDEPFLKDALYDHLALTACLQGQDAALAELAAA